MAQRRMFSKDISENDAFLDMPLSSQALYFHLGMQADDDGFVSPNRIVRMLGCPADDLKLLKAKKFVLQFDDGVIVIKHWKINNYIQKDRRKPTTHQDKFALLTVKSNNGYKLDTTCIQNVRLVKDSKGKERIVKERVKTSRFAPPSLSELTEYIKSNGYTVDPGNFIDFYTSKGWMVGKNKMKDWRAAVRTWAKRDTKTNKRKTIFL
uniref:Replication protein n=1 Tax=uncultured marine virus TaxID=186617 RepID=A0A0F7L7L4_9VIRU|nr:hypothetical protein [uncultured marine virus]